MSRFQSQASEGVKVAFKERSPVSRGHPLEYCTVGDETQEKADWGDCSGFSLFWVRRHFSISVWR